jgi:acetyl-CoA C-acetyltransferase
MTVSHNMRSPIYIIDGARTPFLKAQSGPGPFSAADLATYSGRVLLSRQSFPATALDEVILGCASPSADEVNIGRVVALRLGCGERVTAWTVMRNCASGMQAIDSAIANIERGRSQLVLCGGVDSLSHAPLFYQTTMVRWFAAMMKMKTPWQKLRHFLRLSPSAMLNPVIGIMKGLTDPNIGLIMGQTAENVAWRFNINREAMDAFSVRSHQRAALAHSEGALAEIVPLIDRHGKVYSQDDGVRPDANMRSLAKLKPFFDKTYGRVTPANSSQITDGAALLILASESAVQQHQLKPLGKIVDVQWAGLDPAQMGLGPVHAMTPILQRQNLSIDAVDAWEINEAFAAQVLGCIRAWEDAAYCAEHWGLPSPMGTIPEDKLNVHGGAVALGHPVGASGARIVLHLLRTLEQRGLKRGMASICIGGGQGGAMLIERV